MAHQGLEWHIFKGASPPPLPEGAKLVGNGPYYLVGPTTVVEGKTLRTGELKWRNLQFPFEPPPRIEYAAWMGLIEEQPYVFVFGGKKLDAANAGVSSSPARGGKDEIGASKAMDEAKKQFNEAKKPRWSPATKMYCCDVQNSVWRTILTSDPVPTMREQPAACRIDDYSAMLGFGRNIPELLKISDMWHFDSSNARVGFPDVEGCVWRRMRTEKYSYSSPTPAARIDTAMVSTTSGVYLYGGRVGAIGSTPDSVTDDMWKLSVKEEKWFPVKYSGYYPGPRRNAHLLRVNDTELVLFGGFPEIDKKKEDGAGASSPSNRSMPGSPLAAAGNLLRGGLRGAGGSPKSAQQKEKQYLDVLIFDCRLHIFTRPSIGFLPRNVSTSCFVSDRVPCLYLGRNTERTSIEAKDGSVHERGNGGVAMLRYPAEQKVKKKLREPGIEQSMNDAEKHLFNIRREMDEIDVRVQHAFEEKLDVQHRLDEVISSKNEEDARLAFKQIEDLKDAIRYEEMIENETMSYIAEEITYLFDYLAESSGI